MRKKTFYTLRKNLTFINLTKFVQGKYEQQTSITKYKGVVIVEKTYISRSIFGNVNITYHLTGLNYSEDTIINNGNIVTWYEQIGYGHPCFDKIDDAINFIDNDMKDLNDSIIW